MAKLNVWKHTKAELAEMATMRCRHRHSYLEHYQCYVDDTPLRKPIVEGMLDIETSNLKASFGYVLSWKILVYSPGTPVKKRLLGRALQAQEIQGGLYDKQLVEEFCRCAREFDTLYVYWGKDRRHDLPFLRTRAMKWGLDFPLYKDVSVVDVYDWTRNKLSLHSYRLETVCRELGIPAKTHPLDGTRWCNAMAGDQEALDYIEAHNDEDVVCLEPVVERMKPYVRGATVSI